MAGALELTPKLGTNAAYRAMGQGRGEPQRQRSRANRLAFVRPPRFAPHRPCPPLALDAQEQQAVLDTLNSERFCDTAPAAVHATLLSEGTYVCSVRYPSTGCWPPMRALRAAASAATSSPTRPMPSPNCWQSRPIRSGRWTSTLLKGPAKWTCFHLYVTRKPHHRTLN